MDNTNVNLEAACKHWDECTSLDPGGVLENFWPLFYVYPTLQKQGLSGQALKDRMWKCFQKLMLRWNEAGPQEKLSDMDIYWLTYVTYHVGIADLLCISELRRAINDDYQGFAERVKKITTLPPLELAALIFCPPDKLTFPPGHPLWLARGVKDKGEWRDLGERRVLCDAKNVVGVLRAFAAAIKNASERQDAKDDFRIDEEKLEGLVEASRNLKTKRKYSIDARLEESGIIHKGYGYRDDNGNIVYDVADNSIDRVDTDLDNDQAAIRVRQIEQLKPRELDLLNDELERLEAKKTREQWYGSDKASKITQQVKYLKAKYSKH
jgi:hypothetical protein